MGAAIQKHILPLRMASSKMEAAGAKKKKKTTTKKNVVKIKSTRGLCFNNRIIISQIKGVALLL